MWRGCGMPASYCEAHHIDEWAAHEGRTDIDRGILLCRFHHMNLHHHGHRITRDRGGPFVLHPPGEEPVPLHSRSPLRWMWDPPRARARRASLPVGGPADRARVRDTVAS
ncbi:hypothetical protein GCM10027426_20520 [Microbacterium lacusdiani]